MESTKKGRALQHSDLILQNGKISLLDSRNTTAEALAVVNGCVVQSGSSAVLDRDLFAIPAEEIRDIQVDMTIVNGNVAYERARISS